MTTIGATTILRVEIGLTILWIVVALGAVWRGWRLPRALDCAFTSVARRRYLAIAVAGLVPVLFRLALLPVMPPPRPQIIEEFSYLLQADTFASGRLSNPPLSMAPHFETFQELMRPSYCSIRPIGQGVFLAIGKVLFGHPWAGVCLSVALFCAALCWMLQGWMTPRWSLSGALLFGLWFCVFGFWMNSYWGGTVAGLGGCLVFGAIPRMRRARSPVASGLFAVGVVALATTRTYEGALLVLPAAAIVAWAMLRPARVSPRVVLRQVVTPTATILLLFGAWCLYYNWRTTGKPLSPPYEIGRKAYNMAPPFLFLSANRNLHYRHGVMQRFYEWELGTYDFARTRSGYFAIALWKLVPFWRMYIRPELTIGLLLAIVAILHRRLRCAAIILACSLAGIAAETWAAPYYYAPQIPLVAFAILFALRRSLKLRLFGRRLGLSLPLATACACCSTLLLLTALAIGRVRIQGEADFHFMSLESRLDARYEAAQKIESVPGKHLVFVRYHPDHDYNLEWVWNAANMNSAKIVWARSMGSSEDWALAKCYRNRHVWVVDADTKPAQITPYADHAP
jgi:hypothetical protein